jgi:hypothetical protein
MNTTEIQEIQMYNAQRKIHEERHHKEPLRIEHFLPLIVIFGSGLLAGTFFIGFIILMIRFFVGLIKWGFIK